MCSRHHLSWERTPASPLGSVIQLNYLARGVCSTQAAFRFGQVVVIICGVHNCTLAGVDDFVRDPNTGPNGCRTSKLQSSVVTANVPNVGLARKDLCVLKAQ